MPPIIEIHKLGKKYSVKQVQPYLALRDVVSEKIKNVFTKKEKHSNEFWALQDINLTIEKGERIGIIGRNGAGKSTLLKILSKITPPTTGEIKLNGRVASLLEVGTGFHPELTGKENIYLNGSILGLTKKEINQKLDEIIDFSGVEKFIDTPLKHYSSGMQLRLAFSVAAHLEPEILLIDEVLAVGDIDFQRKCIGKMEEISKSDGRTIVFVSHNMGAISSFCSSCALMEKGKIVEFGTTDFVTSKYINTFSHNEVSFFKKDKLKGLPVEICEVSLGVTKKSRAAFQFDESVQIFIQVINNHWKSKAKIGIAINDIFGKRVAIDSCNIDCLSFSGLSNIKITLPHSFFTPNRYSVDLSILSTGGHLIDIEKDVVFFEVQREGTQYEHLTYDYGFTVMESYFEVLSNPTENS
jgi:lipopolysaccharide transport system ATP-binding protein